MRSHLRYVGKSACHDIFPRRMAEEHRSRRGQSPRATSALLRVLAGHDDNVSDVATRCYMHVASLTRDP